MCALTVLPPLTVPFKFDQEKKMCREQRKPNAAYKQYVTTIHARIYDEHREESDKKQSKKHKKNALHIHST